MESPQSSQSHHPRRRGLVAPERHSITPAPPTGTISCSASQCVCKEGWRGDLCDTPCDCHERGSRTCDQNTGTCDCIAGWTGAKCNQCAPNFFPTGQCYKYCNPVETCNGHGVCNPATGSCTCDKAWSGSGDCSNCGLNYYGSDCGTFCDAGKNCTSTKNGFCDPADGSCQCYEGWFGTNCGQADVTLLNMEVCKFPAGMQNAYVKLSANYSRPALTERRLFEDAGEIAGGASNRLLSEASLRRDEFISLHGDEPIRRLGAPGGDHEQESSRRLQAGNTSSNVSTTPSPKLDPSFNSTLEFGLSFALNTTKTYGYGITHLQFTQQFEMTQIDVNEGSLAGGTFVTIDGRGFGYSPNHNYHSVFLLYDTKHAISNSSCAKPEVLVIGECYVVRINMLCRAVWECRTRRPGWGLCQSAGEGRIFVNEGRRIAMSCGGGYGKEFRSHRLRHV